MIEVGEYVRVDGQIGKIIDICDCEQCKARGYLEPVIDNHNIYITIYDKQHDFHGIKHSKNIIDLIEEGDLVNGKEVYEFDDEEGTVLGIPIFEDGLFDTIDCYVPLDSIKIHSILTSEMYEANCYKVKEE